MSLIGRKATYFKLNRYINQVAENVLEIKKRYIHKKRYISHRLWNLITKNNLGRLIKSHTII